MDVVSSILNLALNIAYYIVIAHVIMSWLITFQVLNVYQPIVGKSWRWLNQVLEPVYGPIRRVIPNIAGMDLAPLVVLIGMIILRRLVL